MVFVNSFLLISVVFLCFTSSNYLRLCDVIAMLGVKLIKKKVLQDHWRSAQTKSVSMLRVGYWEMKERHYAQNVL